MSKIVRCWFALIALLALWARPSAACTAAEGYSIPSNFELVQKAEVIVLARVTEVPESLAVGDGSRDQSVVKIAPIRFLKGSADGELALFGWTGPPSWRGFPTPTTLQQSHFSAGLGACIRQLYTPGELVVAMFERDPQMQELTGLELSQIGDPWARAVETVNGPDDIWVQAVERYVALESGPPATLDVRIRSSVDELGATNSPGAQAMAVDLEAHLTGKPPENVWVSFATPESTAAGVFRSKGPVLQCMAGTAPTVMTEGTAAGRVELVADDMVHMALASPATPAEKEAMKDPLSLPNSKQGETPELTLYRFVDPSKLFASLRVASRTVQLRREGQLLASGNPVDALYRWAAHCQKLQALPAPDPSLILGKAS